MDLIIVDTTIQPTSADAIRAAFTPFFEQAQKWELQAKSIVVTDRTQKAEMQMARTARLALREVRINAEKTRKELKEESLRYGQAVQSVYNMIAGAIEPLEAYLEDQEKFAEKADAKDRAELKEARLAELAPLSEFVPSGLDFATMSGADYSTVLSGAKLQAQAKKDAQEKAEREAREKAEKEAKEAAEKAAAEKAERERIEAENQQLKAAAEIAAKECAAAEKAKADAELALQAERAEAERVKKEAEAKEAANKKALEDAARLEDEAKKAAELAPDIEKIETFVSAILLVPAPIVGDVMSTKVGRFVNELAVLSAKFLADCKKK